METTDRSRDEWRGKSWSGAGYGGICCSTKETEAGGSQVKSEQDCLLRTTPSQIRKSWYKCVWCGGMGDLSLSTSNLLTQVLWSVCIQQDLIEGHSRNQNVNDISNNGSQDLFSAYSMPNSFTCLRSLITTEPNGHGSKRRGQRQAGG